MNRGAYFKVIPHKEGEPQDYISLTLDRDGLRQLLGCLEIAKDLLDPEDGSFAIREVAIGLNVEASHPEGLGGGLGSNLQPFEGDRPPSLLREDLNTHKIAQALGAELKGTVRASGGYFGAVLSALDRADVVSGVKE